MHSLLVVGIEVVEAEIYGQANSAALSHRVAARGGEISHNNPTHPPIIIFNSNSTHDHLSDSTTNSNTINSDVNEFTTHHRNVDVGARMITGQTPAVGIWKTLHLPLTRPWGLSLDVGDVVI